MHPFLNTATRLAREVGHLLIKRLEQFQGDFATRRQLAERTYHDAENHLAELLIKCYPEHGIVNSTMQHNTKSDSIWYLEVINGIDNYARGIPHFALCTAILQNNKPQQCLIYDPMQEEMFTANLGDKAQLNNYRLRVSQEKLEHALIATTIPNNLASYSTACPALMLAYVAAGRLDGFYGKDLSVCVNAAGSLLVKTAGGLVIDESGQDCTIHSNDMIVSHPKLIKHLLHSLAKR